jgi:hypothetical protein
MYYNSLVSSILDEIDENDLILRDKSYIDKNQIITLVKRKTENLNNNTKTFNNKRCLSYLRDKNILLRTNFFAGMFTKNL